MALNPGVKTPMRESCIVHNVDPRMLNLTRTRMQMERHKSNVFANEHFVFPMRVWDNPMVANWSFITILRNPLNRVLSFSRYKRESGVYRLVPGTKSYGMAVLRFARKHNYQGSNLYTRVFSGRQANCSSKNMTHMHCDDEVTEEDLDNAKTNLIKFSVVMITEWFAESSALLKEILGFQHLDTSAKNVNGDRHGNFHATNRSNDVHIISSKRTIYGTNPKSNASHQLPEDYLEELRDLNKYDIKLYEFAKRLCRCQVDTWLFRW
eukprot:1374211-Amorphochlora_amoeboformis.AAC.1